MKTACNCNCKHENERLKHCCVVLSAEKEELERRLKQYENDKGIDKDIGNHQCITCWNYDHKEEYCETIMDPILDPKEKHNCCYYSHIIPIGYNLTILKDRGVCFDE